MPSLLCLWVSCFRFPLFTVTPAVYHQQGFSPNMAHRHLYERPTPIPPHPSRGSFRPLTPTQLVTGHTQFSCFFPVTSMPHQRKPTPAHVARPPPDLTLTCSVLLYLHPPISLTSVTTRPSWAHKDAHPGGTSSPKREGSVSWVRSLQEHDRVKGQTIPRRLCW